MSRRVLTAIEVVGGLVFCLLFVLLLKSAFDNEAVSGRVVLIGVPSLETLGIAWLAWRAYARSFDRSRVLLVALLYASNVGNVVLAVLVVGVGGAV